MERFFKIGTCDWCNRHQQKVFMTTYNSGVLKYMCTRCKGFIDYQNFMSKGVENSIDTWDEEHIGKTDIKTEEKDPRFRTSMKEDSFVIKEEGSVKLIGYHSKEEFTVKSYHEKALDGNKEREWTYNSLAPASRRFSSEVKALGGK